MESKQYATKQPMGHWRNQRGILKIPWEKWKWKSMAIQAYLSKQEKCQIDNLNLHIKEVEKEEQSPKLAEGNNKEQSSN